MQDQYVILTGGKNNAGDFLIKRKAKDLLAALRPDRNIVDYDGWVPFSDEQLHEVNASKAVILTGGPALQSHMRPIIYPMVKQLDKVKVPIVMMGVGWKSIRGNWDDTHNYRLSKETVELLNRIDDSGYLSSVRDYHTLNMLLYRGFKNVLMTGCPALFSLDHLNKPFMVKKELNKVVFSMGVAFVKSASMEKSVQDVLLRLKEYFKEKDFEVVFHHSIDKKKYFTIHNANKRFYKQHQKFIGWLSKHNIPYVDISGSAGKLENYYKKCDFHVGYRAHAHIFMSSISKPSALISEDGRGKALRDVIGGLVFNGYNDYKDGVVSRALSGLKISIFDRYSVDDKLGKDLVNNIDYELTTGMRRLSIPRKTINAHFQIMNMFIKQLP